MLADRAVQCSPPNRTSSTTWLTMTEMTLTIVYRTIFLPWGERARSFRPDGERSIRSIVPTAPARPTNRAAEGQDAGRYGAPTFVPVRPRGCPQGFGRPA